MSAHTPTDGQITAYPVNGWDMKLLTTEPPGVVVRLHVVVAENDYEWTRRYALSVPAAEQLRDDLDQHIQAIRSGGASIPKDRKH